MQFTNVPRYMQDYAGEAKGDPAVAEHRAGALYELLEAERLGDERREALEAAEASETESAEAMEWEATEAEYEALEAELYEAEWEEA